MKVGCVGRIILADLTSDPITLTRHCGPRRSSCVLSYLMLSPVARICSTRWSSRILGSCVSKVRQKVITRNFHAAIASASWRVRDWRIPQTHLLTKAYVGTEVTVAPSSTQLETSLISGGQEVIIHGEDGRQSRYHAVWLRYNCRCPVCVQPHSGQRLVDTAKVDPNTYIDDAYISEDGNTLHVRWGDSQHWGLVELDFLQQHCYHGDRQPMSRDQVTHLPRLSYQDVTGSDTGLYRWLQHLNEDGMCLVQNAPTELSSLPKIVELIGPVQDTIYGKLFDVRCDPNPINVAYTSVALDYHMDLVYYESPPGLQFLHCIRFDDCVVGGNNRMLNVVAVAERFRQKHPEDFDVLTKVPATFQKVHFDRADPVIMKYQRPHISVSHRGEIVNVVWAPQFEGPLSVDYADVQPYYRAYRKFSTAIQTAQDRVKVRLAPGDILSFNNRTILHSRALFELNGGQRHLQGCYLNIDTFKCKLAVLAHHHGDEQPLKHVGNQCWF